MVIFLLIAIVGLILSLITHFGILFGVLDDLPKSFMVVLNSGLFIWTGLICVNSSLLEKKFDKTFRKKAFVAALPGWLRVITVLMVLYAIVTIVYFCISAYLITFQIKFFELTMDKLNVGITSVDIAAYTTVISMYYYYKYLRRHVRGYCRYGHPVAPSAKQCEQCGDVLE